MKKKITDKGLEEKFKYLNDLRIPDYLVNVPARTIFQLDFSPRNSIEWYAEFLEEVDASVGRRFMPIYRMADGEFIFCVGFRPSFLSGYSLSKEFFNHIKQSIKYWLRQRDAILETCWGESYAKDELIYLKDYYVQCLRKIATQGKLAIHFNRSNSKFSEQYISPMCSWFDEVGISVNSKNYIPFYFIYAMLCSSAGKKIIKNKSILVVTSVNDQKKINITNSLKVLGASSVEFIQISPNRSMLDKLSLEHVKKKIDLVLVGAGIGAANILIQLEELQTVCIDSGVFIEILADSSKRGRVFTVPD